MSCGCPTETTWHIVDGRVVGWSDHIFCDCEDEQLLTEDELVAQDTSKRKKYDTT